jgi:hypothetical protein
MGAGRSFPRGKVAENEAETITCNTSAEVKKIWIYKSISPYAFIA